MKTFMCWLSCSIGFIISGIITKNYWNTFVIMYGGGVYLLLYELLYVRNILSGKTRIRG